MSLTILVVGERHPRGSRRLHILEAVLEGKMTTCKLERVVIVAVLDIHRVWS